ncbi:DUF202 domain-containing protein [Streptomyces mexicanus]|uniref:DUF202 domain-containing protein n=1 Tax=Streptomyces mexicanus TaxID=178566 RepID=UPI00364E23F8
MSGARVPGADGADGGGNEDDGGGGHRAGAAGPSRDPGLQPERTRLAWRRTTLSGTVAAVLAVKTALHGGPSPAGLTVCALCCVLWLGFLLLAEVRIRRLGRSAAPPALAPRLAAAAAVCTVALAVCAAALVV